MLLQLLYQEEKLIYSEYKEEADNDDEDYQWDYEYAYFSEYGNYYESD